VKKARKKEQAARTGVHMDHLGVQGFVLVYSYSREPTGTWAIQPLSKEHLVQSLTQMMATHSYKQALSAHTAAKEERMLLDLQDGAQAQVKSSTAASNGMKDPFIHHHAHAHTHAHTYLHAHMHPHTRTHTYTHTHTKYARTHTRNNNSHYYKSTMYTSTSQGHAFMDSKNQGQRVTI